MKNFGFVPVMPGPIVEIIQTDAANPHADTPEVAALWHVVAEDTKVGDFYDSPYRGEEEPSLSPVPLPDPRPDLTFAHIPTVPGFVREVFVGKELFPIHPDLASQWRQVPDGTEVGNHFNGETFQPLLPATEQELTEQHDAMIKQKIAALEAKQGRAVRGMLLGENGAEKRLQELNAAIAALRAQLKG
jgi:hypothetical protein